MKNVLIVPARGGSKEIPRKNIKSLNGKPLMCYVIESALKSLVDLVVVSTEDDEIAEIASRYNVFVHRRSLSSCADNVHAVECVLECLNALDEVFDNVCMALATSPLTTSGHIDDAFCLLDDTCDTVVSVCKIEKPASSYRIIRNNLLHPAFSVSEFHTRRQDVKDNMCEVNGALFLSKVAHLFANKSFHVGKVKPYPMERSESVDINNMDDWLVAEKLLKC